MWHVSRSTSAWLLRAIGALLYVHGCIGPILAEQATILEETIRQWKAYEEFARSLQGAQSSVTIWDSGKVERRKVIRKQNHQCVLSCSIEDDKPSEYWKIANPWYAAVIKRSKSNPSEVSLGEFSDDPQAAFPGAAGSSFATTLPGFSPQFYVLLTPLSQFVADPHYKIKDITRITQKDRPLIQLDYTYTSDKPKTGATTMGQGRLVLDPSRCWCIIRSKGTSTTSVRGVRVLDMEAEIEYETVDHPSGFPLVKSSTTSGKQHSPRRKIEAKKSYTRKSEYEWEVNDHVPNEEFMLSAFGLPEPNGFKPPAKSHAWVWLGAAVVVLSALAVLFAWLKRRRAAAIQGQCKSPTVTSLP